MEHPFRLGITVGRFQMFHKGHQAILDRALALCGRVGVLIGSSQESGTNKNPFPYETRAEVLRAIYGDRIGIYPLPDIGVGNTAAWGDYVLANVRERFGMMPDLIVSGKEGRRIDWFDSVEGVQIAELYLPKTIEISASRMREWLLENDAASWKAYTDERLWDRFDELRALVLASYQNHETASI